MSTLPQSEIAELLSGYFPDPSSLLLDQLSVYLDLLVKWNERMNLTAIRDPRTMVTRHFGESLFAARHLPPAQTLLDLGSGAGFPGVPIFLALPHLRITLAESQNKKAVFLREVVRILELPIEVWGRRAEELPESRRFDVVTLRAVDRPVEALRLARALARPGGTVISLGASRTSPQDLAMPGGHGFLSLLGS